MALAQWQSSFTSENELAHHIAQDYPRWLQETFGDPIEIQPFAERILHIFYDGNRYQELSLRRVRGVYVLLFYPNQWDTVRLRSRIQRPKSAYPRDNWGFRFVMTNLSDYELFKAITKQTFDTLISPSGGPLPRTLGEKLRPYVELAAHLDGSTYTASQVVDRLGQIRPAIVNLTKAPNAEALAADLMLLRLLERLDDGRYRRWEHLSDATIDRRWNAAGGGDPL